jgi:hypothetical protein
MEQKYKERLLRVADLVDQPKYIDLDVWAQPTKYYSPDHESMHTCGYVACAIGHAMFDPWHKERGFRNSADNLFPVYKNFAGWGAVYYFYGVDTQDARKLFSSNTYMANVTGADVAARIREFVAQHEQTENEIV